MLVIRLFLTGTRTVLSVDAAIVCDIELTKGFEYAIPVVFEENEGMREVLSLGHMDSALSVYDHQFDPSVLSSSTRASRVGGLIVTTASISARQTVSVVAYSAIE